MEIDLVLTVLHHLLVFGLFATVMGEALLLRSTLDGRAIDLLARMDMGLGISAILILVVGGLRVYFGLKGPEYYIENPWFWAKIASFLAAALVSIPATIRFAAWRRRRQSEPDFLPDAGELKRTLLVLGLERGLLVLVIIFAATMARYS